jgi:hypothetical protein
MLFYFSHVILSYTYSFLLTFSNYLIESHLRYVSYYIIIFYLAELS